MSVLSLSLVSRVADGRRLMTCGEDQILRVIDRNTGTQIYSKDTGHSLR